MNNFEIAVTVAAVVLFSLWFNGFVNKKVKNLLQHWADENNMKLMRLEARWFRLGPFMWTTSRFQLVYYVTVWDRGKKRHAYVRCGNFWFGMMTEDIEVSWD